MNIAGVDYETEGREMPKEAERADHAAVETRRMPDVWMWRRSGSHHDSSSAWPVARPRTIIVTDLHHAAPSSPGSSA
jgi:hypothetical protein